MRLRAFFRLGRIEGRTNAVSLQIHSDHPKHAQTSLNRGRARKTAYFQNFRFTSVLLPFLPDKRAKNDVFVRFSHDKRVLLHV